MSSAAVEIGALRVKVVKRITAILMRLKIKSLRHTGQTRVDSLTVCFEEFITEQEF